jgi:hypothetical protein
MNKTAQKLLLSFFVFVLLLITYHLSPLTARAQTTPGTQIFTVIPPKVEVSVKPGEQVRKILQFRNEGDDTAYLSIIARDFIVTKDNGQPDFVDSKVSGRWSAASWLRINPATLAVPPKATTNITLNIFVPLDALPGGHYSGVLYQAKGTPLQTGQGVGVGTGIQQVVGSLIYITVAGPVNEKAMVKRFEIPGFSEYGPIPVVTEIGNQSDIHITPKGTITIRNLFGQNVANLNLEERNIFPGASLTYTNSLDKKVLIGRFRADLIAAYGTGSTLSATTYFWVFPWKICLVIILTIILITLIIQTGYKQIKKRQDELEAKLLEEKAEVEKLKEQIKNTDK